MKIDLAFTLFKFRGRFWSERVFGWACFSCFFSFVQNLFGLWPYLLCNCIDHAILLLSKGKPTSTVFSDIDLSEKEWADFDEESGKSTLISEFEIKFVQVKN